MYQVGFGDCFLVSFFYRRPLPDGRDARHILVDYGTTRAPRRGAKPLVDAAQLITTHCGGELDVIVATHRHRDHIDGFGERRTAQAIEALRPKLIVRPWTDDPAAAANATAPDPRGRGAGAANLRFAASINAAQSYAGAVAAAIGRADIRTLRGELGVLAATQLPNLDAIRNLERWGRDAAAAYVHAGSPSRIEEFVPGITVRVLGPPTVDQAPEMLSQRSSDVEYWMLQQRNLTNDSAALEAPRSARRASLRAGALGPVSWLVERLEAQRVASYLRIVRSVDDALNNTSVILLIDAGDKRLLFPGDAQIENWSWALQRAPDRRRLAALLAGVDLYKVGHHGSRNATPRSLFGLWGDSVDGRQAMVALMSTLSGVHGHSDATRVPRATLVAALARRMTLLTTDQLDPSRPYLEVAASTTRGESFAPVVQH